MTEAEDKLLTAAIEHWVTGRFGHLQRDVLLQREQTPQGDVLIRMPAEQWRTLTDALYRDNLQLGREAWMIVARIVGELPTRKPAPCTGCGCIEGELHRDHCINWKLSPNEHARYMSGSLSKAQYTMQIQKFNQPKERI